MKWTKSPRIAMERLAEVLGWTIMSAGRAWHINPPSTFIGLTFSATSALCALTRVAMAPKEWGGEGMTGEDVRNLIRFRPVHLYSRGRGSLQLPASIAATDETTLYAAYFNPETGE
ncbi:MAG: hypothetical protein V3S55_10005 [Nitrospiraceae bacterium]